MCTFGTYQLLKYCDASTPNKLLPHGYGYSNSSPVPLAFPLSSDQRFDTWLS